MWRVSTILALDQRRGESLGVAIAPKLPPPPTGRYLRSQRRALDQGCSEAILFGLVMACLWDVQVRLSSGSESSR